jgi:hypothetical protein
VLQALRADQCSANRGEVRSRVRQQMRSAFFVDEPSWKAAVLAQAREAAQQALRGLAT